MGGDAPLLNDFIFYGTSNNTAIIILTNFYCDQEWRKFRLQCIGNDHIIIVIIIIRSIMLLYVDYS